MCFSHKRTVTQTVLIGRRCRWRRRRHRYIIVLARVLAWKGYDLHYQDRD